MDTQSTQRLALDAHTPLCIDTHTHTRMQIGLTVEPPHCSWPGHPGPTSSQLLQLSHSQGCMHIRPGLISALMPGSQATYLTCLPATVGTPLPREIEMEFNEQTGQMAAVRRRAWPEKCTDQQPVYTKLVPFIPFLVFFSMLIPPEPP